MLVAKRRPTRQQVAEPKSIPAPVGGLNARDAIAAMPETDALVMTNWFPTPTDIGVRHGCANYATALPGWVETLMVYNAQSGSNKMFGAAGSKIFDVTAAGPVGAAVVSGNTSARWQYTNFGTPGGEFLVAVNGADKMQLYNGSTWQQVTGVSAPIAITGVDTALLIAVAPFQQRLIFIEKASSRFWYLPVLQVGGAALSFDLSSQFRLGGYLMAFVDWNVDTADGPQSYATFISSMGEVVVYQGYDPSIPGAWTKVGTFRIGRPVGRRCVLKVGSDAYVISADGLFALSQAMLTDRAQDNKAVSNKITNLINNDVQAYSANFGWHVLLHPIGNKIIVNVPQVENAIQYQYVMNTITGAWCLFQGWNACCWELFNDSLFYGGNGVVVKADVGTSDNGANIQTDLKPAFSNFGTSGQQKQWTMVRPVFTADNDFAVIVALNVDFSDLPPTQPLSLPPLPLDAVWDISPWDSTAWNSGPKTRFAWATVGGIGFYASLRMRTLSKGAQISLQSIDYVGQIGGIL
jgi:hypothetical protein